MPLATRGSLDPQALEVDEGAEEGGNLDVGPLDKESNEGLQGRKAVDLELTPPGRLQRWRWSGEVWQEGCRETVMSRTE